MADAVRFETKPVTARGTGMTITDAAHPGHRTTRALPVASLAVGLIERLNFGRGVVRDDRGLRDPSIRRDVGRSWDSPVVTEHRIEILDDPDTDVPLSGD